MTTLEPRTRPHEQTRALYPDESGHVERDGVRVFYEVYGAGEATVLLLPTWSIVHSRVWKFQIAYLARHLRVVTFDGRGNGFSDRPREPDAYREEEFAADALAVMDATATERAVLVSLSRGAERALLLAADQPHRVAGMVFIAPALPLPPTAPRARAEQEFIEPRDSYKDWEKWNSHYWLANYEDFLQFFFSQMFNEPHSTKQIEDCIGWALETDAETLVATQLANRLPDEAALLELVEQPDQLAVVVAQRVGDRALRLPGTLAEHDQDRVVIRVEARPLVGRHCPVLGRKAQALQEEGGRGDELLRKLRSARRLFPGSRDAHVVKRIARPSVVVL